MNFCSSIKRFNKILVEEIKFRLLSPTYHFIDNSLDYYQNLNSAALAEDRIYFSINSFANIDNYLEQHIEKIRQNCLTKEFLFNHLSDQHSKCLLVLDALYDIMGHRFVKFPYYSLDNIKRRIFLSSQYKIEYDDLGIGDNIKMFIPYSGNELFLYNIPIYNKRIFLITTPEFIYQIFNFFPYGYYNEKIKIDVSIGDIVIDCGACLGDTALLFSVKAGKSGGVLSMEPHPYIGNIFKKNMVMNPEFSSTIKLMENAVTDISKSTVELTLSGTGSHLGANPKSIKKVVSVKTVSIDSEIEQKKLSRVNFIKMDIEGSELKALKGAVDTIRKYKPKLAICLYHKPEDYYLIPEFLLNLNLGYKLYLEHHFMNNWETVLYAISE